MNVLNADTWITSVLKNDAVLKAAVNDRIFQDHAPEGTDYPLINFEFVSAVPVENAGADRIMDDELWRIKIYTNEPTYKNIGAIADRIRFILHKASGTGVIGAFFTGELRFSEVRNGITYKSLILEFELFTQ